jgi:hypothetical protein
LKPKALTKIDAVFEVDENLFDDVSDKAWAEGTKRFAQGLMGGYDDIAEKIFAAVMAQVIREWVERMGGKVEEMKTTIAKLRGEKAQKIDFLQEPEIQQALAEFEGPEPHEDLAAGITPTTQKQADAMAAKAMGWPRLPANGDPAYTMYGGANYGVLKNVNNMVQLWTIKQHGFEEAKRYFRFMASIVPDKKHTQEWSSWHDMVHVGYQEQPKWDAARKLWICDADPD